ncbi:hypothetical protein Tsubulata_027412 [Turnera subulata]|uniref:Uncharacterized protein n=1 Tax=Turnera subulata TaxID=218843 RepID=A0A9Q0FES2_9ROSI|nr:hypothetical protein Tsubulata_027412 [Turnera subulata]
MPSPVAQYALDRGFSSDLIFTPERTGEVVMMSSLQFDHSIAKTYVISMWL